MSLPLDQKVQPKDVIMEAGGVPQQSPQYDEGSHPCRFRGRGRRGRCNRGANVSFFRQFARLFVIFSTFSFLYTQRSSIKESLQPLSNVISPWLAGPYDVIKTVADVPFQLHPFFGLVFYSAVAAFFLTSLKMRLIQKRKERIGRWLAESPSRHEGN